MVNYKSPDKRKRNHINVNFTDADLEKIRIVQQANPDMKLDKLIVYSLLKVYGSGFVGDYNARYVQSLHQRKDVLEQDIQRLKEDLERKQSDLESVNEEIDRVMRGEE